jgi:hypothetical protein
MGQQPQHEDRVGREAREARTVASVVTSIRDHVLATKVVRRGTAAVLVALVTVPVAMAPAQADAVCRDGWYSSSSGSGTCSWHGGVDYWVNPTPNPTYIDPVDPVVTYPLDTSTPAVAGTVHLKRLKLGHKDSDSVRLLQKRLNKVLLRGAAKLPVTGNYDKQTRAAVRLWQMNVDGASGRGADGALGPRQARALFPAGAYLVKA